MNLKFQISDAECKMCTVLDKQLGKSVKSIQFSLEIGVERAAIYNMSSQ